MQQLFLPGMTMPSRPAETHNAREALASYPDMTTTNLCRHAKVLGIAAELLVDSVLMRLGERAYATPEFERHDRVLLLPGPDPSQSPALPDRHRQLRLQPQAEIRAGSDW